MPDQMVPLGSVDVPERKDPPGKWDPPDPRAYLALRDPQESQVPQDQVAKGDYVVKRDQPVPLGLLESADHRVRTEFKEALEREAIMELMVKREILD